MGTLTAGPVNAITDVPGVRVGHESVLADGVRSGVTAIVPASDLYASPIRGSFFSGNGHGKVVGTTQVLERGEIETPILLTGTLSTFRVADALLHWTIAANPGALSVNPLVGETNDGGWGAPPAARVEAHHVRSALESAAPGLVAEGGVGAGTGTRALGFKGGIGTASRLVAVGGDGFTIGVLVQSNHGGTLTIEGVPVGRHLDGDLPGELPGSIMVVVGTDAPLDSRQLGRLARRAVYALARTGAWYSDRSGDYAISFSTVRAVDPARVDDTALNQLFLGALEAVDEAVVNSLTMAADAVEADGTPVRAIPMAGLLAACRRHGLDRPGGTSWTAT